MKTAVIIQQAHALYRAFGDKAEAQAAQRALTAADPKEADIWRRIRRQIVTLRGTRVA